jgi:Na+/proline symporter
MRLAKTPPVAPIRAVSILVGVIIGCILAYAFQVNLPTLFFEMNVASLVVFVAIPMLSGFIVGLLYPVVAFRNGLYVGLISGLFNSIVATVKLIYAPTLAPGEIYAFSLFAIVSVFAWTVLAAVAAELASRFYD